MANEGQNDPGENLEESQDTKTQNPEEGEGSPSSSGQTADDGEVVGLKAQLQREREARIRAEESARLVNQYLGQQKGGQQQDELDPDLAALDKVIDPLFTRRLKKALDPYNTNFSRIVDALDNVDFRLGLVLNDPELAERITGGVPFDEIEAVRVEAAQKLGLYLPRSEALAYLRGKKSEQESVKKRREAKKKSVADEADRKKAAALAESGEAGPAERKSAGAMSPEIQAIREKLNRGERLTKQERDTFGKHLGRVKF